MDRATAKAPQRIPCGNLRGKATHGTKSPFFLCRATTKKTQLTTAINIPRQVGQATGKG